MVCVVLFTVARLRTEAYGTRVLTWRVGVSYVRWTGSVIIASNLRVSEARQMHGSTRLRLEEIPSRLCQSRTRRLYEVTGPCRLASCVQSTCMA
ncbi:uncharacterized protein B0H18DRAFT_968452, partial [Fomitopsis serialis]|uniref:uncharacterized protein n=1 Tax=Fomitopsis serialis TaxID=139415 RepID=UPI0020072BB5